MSLFQHIFKAQTYKSYLLSVDFDMEEVEDAMQPFMLVRSGGIIDGRFLRANNETAVFLLMNGCIKINS